MTDEYKKFLKDAEKRRAKVVELSRQKYSDGRKRWSNREIGQKMSPTISAQRVRQILVQEGEI